MSAPDALVRTSPLARTSPDLSNPTAAAEAQLRALLEEISTLELEVEQLTDALTVFSAQYEQRLGQAFEGLDVHERWVRRIQALQDEVARLAHELREGPSAPPPEPKAKKKKAAVPEEEAWTPGATLDDGSSEDASAAPIPLEEAALALKQLYRKLARLLHPDLARSDEERDRLHALMTQVNVAYENEDRATLELLLARVDRGELLQTGVSSEEKLAYLEQRLRALAEVRRSLMRDRERLQDTSTFRLYVEWQTRRDLGRDYFAETAAELELDVERVRGDGTSRMDRLERAVRELSTLKHSLTSSQPRELRAFDPILESPLVRRGVAHLEQRRASSKARELAHALEEAAEKAPAEAVLVLMAFFAEIAGRPPDALESSRGWPERYALAVEGIEKAPSYEQLLVKLPPPLELGLREQQGKVRFGVQLREAELLAGVPLALARREVSALARRVLEAIGPREACKGCGAQVCLLHLMRTRGLDELNGLVCPRCGKIGKSYFLFNWSEGQEALLPFALQVGLVDEAVLKLGGAGIAFQQLASTREALTGGELKRLFLDLYCTPYGIETSAADFQLKAKGKALADSAPVPRSPVTLSLSKKGKSNPALADGERGLLELLKSRIERRFRPGT